MPKKPPHYARSSPFLVCKSMSSSIRINNYTSTQRIMSCLYGKYAPCIDIFEVIDELRTQSNVNSCLVILSSDHGSWFLLPVTWIGGALLMEHYSVGKLRSMLVESHTKSYLQIIVMGWIRRPKPITGIDCRTYHVAASS